MKPRFILPLFGIFIVLVAACAPPPVLRSDDYLTDSSLVSGEPCEAPCWRGIIPGETLWRDAVITIEDDPQLKNLQVESSETTDEEGNNVTARAGAFQDGDAQACCQIFSADGEVVDSIFLLLAPNTRLEEVIDIYGEPAWLTGEAITEDQAIMSLIFPDQNFVVYAFVAGEAEGGVTASSEIIGSIYMTTDNMNRIIETTNLYEWDGYQSFRAYVDGNFDLQASISNDGADESEGDE